MKASRALLGVKSKKDAGGSEETLKRFFRRILAAVFFFCGAVSCVGCKETYTGPCGVSVYPSAIGDTIYVDKGSLFLDEVAVVSEINAETETSESRKDAFLVFEVRFDFEKYFLKSCGV